LNDKLVKLKDFFAGDVDNRGTVRVAVKNLDGDNLADLVAGTGPGTRSKVTAYTGAEVAKTTSAAVLDLEAFGNLNGVYVG